MYLPGTPNELIGDLRRNMGISQQELSRRIGIPTSQISRLESGRIKNISSDILVKLAKEFKVSTDYILGLSTIRNRKNHDISELGLSDGAVTPLLKGKIDAQTLNRLLEHRNFPNLIKLIKIYFEDTLVAGIRGRNEIIDMAVMSLVDFKKDAQDDINLLKSQKLGDHEAEDSKTYTAFLEKDKKPFLDDFARYKKGHGKWRIDGRNRDGRYDTENTSGVSGQAARRYIGGRYGGGSHRSGGENGAAGRG